MYNLFSYFYTSTPEESSIIAPDNSEIVVNDDSEIKPTIVSPPKPKCSHVDAHLLIWDLHHLTYHDLEKKYRAKYLTLCNLLKNEGYPIFQQGYGTNVETKTLVVPQELLLMD